MHSAVTIWSEAFTMNAGGQRRGRRRLEVTKIDKQNENRSKLTSTEGC